MWPDGTHPMLFSEISFVSACQSFRPVAQFFFSAKTTIFGFFLNTERIWPYKYAYDVPLENTDFKYI